MLKVFINVGIIAMRKIFYCEGECQVQSPDHVECNVYNFSNNSERLSLCSIYATQRSQRQTSTDILSSRRGLRENGGSGKWVDEAAPLDSHTISSSSKGKSPPRPLSSQSGLATHYDWSYSYVQQGDPLCSFYSSIVGFVSSELRRLSTLKNQQAILR